MQLIGLNISAKQATGSNSRSYSKESVHSQSLGKNISAVVNYHISDVGTLAYRRRCPCSLIFNDNVSVFLTCSTAIGKIRPNITKSKSGCVGASSSKASSYKKN